MRYNKKGFTLVEVIVVLVILAILAAIMIPAMTGWIDKAKEKQVVVEARAALLACQTIASENYATTPKAATVDTDAAKTLSGMNGTISDVVVAAGKVTSMKYTQAAGDGGLVCTYTSAGGFVVA